MYGPDTRQFALLIGGAFVLGIGAALGVPWLWRVLLKPLFAWLGS